MAAPMQNAENHARYVPGFHFITGSLTIAVLVWSVKRAIILQTGDAVLLALMAVALLGQFWYTRAFPLAVQDRLIRLEERLRLARLLPAELQGRLDEFTADQLIGMRFASDAELPALAKKVLDENLATRKGIKEQIKTWRPDYMRA
ncbi:MAG: hypothetical protein JWM95_2776 [Gemmatimonadetes bacterium]|nr:hypothetical protein [Gemmatimonadota bacterium]